MFFIPGWLVAIVTFPGVIVHEAAHMFFCKLRKVAIIDVCFFRFGNPAGYVIHEGSEDFRTVFLIAVGPLFVNTFLCLLFCFPASVPVYVFDKVDLISFVLIWLGVSIGMHAFPSTVDATGLWNAARKAVKTGSILAILSFPLVIFIYTANVLSMFWFDLFYGAGVGIGLPLLLLKGVS